MPILVSLLLALLLGSSTHRDEYALREAWIGLLQVGPIKAVLQFRIEADEAGKTRVFFDSISEKRTDFVATTRVEGDELAFDVAEVGASFHGRLNAARDRAEGRFAQGGRVLPLAVERKTSVYEPKYSWETRPQRPRAPFPYTSEEVTITNARDGLTLAGTLTIPDESDTAEHGGSALKLLMTNSGRDPIVAEETLICFPHSRSELRLSSCGVHIGVLGRTSLDMR